MRSFDPTGGLWTEFRQRWYAHFKAHPFFFALPLAFKFFISNPPPMDKYFSDDPHKSPSAPVTLLTKGTSIKLHCSVGVQGNIFDYM